jgi:adenylate kinase
MRMHVALIGAPASGKATLSPRLARRFDLLRVSPDVLLRSNLSRQSTLGLLARRHIQRGDLLPDEIVAAMLEERMRQAPNARGALFEAFPRTVSQAAFLDEMLKGLGRRLDVVLRLTVTEEVVLERLQGRSVCQQCRSTFHRECEPFIGCPEGECEGEHLYRRDDDQPHLAGQRLRAFRRSSAPLMDLYQQAGKLVILDANGSPDAVERSAARVLEAFRERSLETATSEDVDRIRALRPVAKPLSEAQVQRPTLDVAFLGGPGSGKGTQSERLARELGIPHIATGDLFRSNIREQTELGRLAQTYMHGGELVPDEITDGMVRRRLGEPDAADGFVLDGFPRTLPQAEALTEMLNEMGRRLSSVVHLDVVDEVIVARLSGRLVCRECQRPFHETDNPFESCPEGRCRGEHLDRRDDDAPETVRARLRTYRAETEPLVGYYRELGILVEIDGQGDVEEVARRITTLTDRLTRN